jgi:hypothetical protein
MTMPKNGQQQGTEEHSEGKAVRSAHHKPIRRTFMALFVSIILLAIGLAFIGIGGNAWSKGGYSNVMLAMWWGIAGYLVFGFGAWFTYYAYVIKPAKAAHISRLAPGDRPTLRVESTVLKKLPDGRGFVEVTVRNSGHADAPNATVNTTIWGVPVQEGSAHLCPEPHQAPIETMPSVGLIGVGERRSGGTGVILTKEQMSSVADKKTRLYVYMVSKYGAKDEYFLEFYARYDPETGYFHDCPAHNDGN